MAVFRRFVVYTFGILMMTSLLKLHDMTQFHRLRAVDRVLSTDTLDTPCPLGTIVHVTKEFGPASVGGMGVAVSGLALAQLAAGCDVAVLLPLYTFLPKLLDGQLTAVRLIKRRVRNVTITGVVYMGVYEGVTLYLIEHAPNIPVIQAWHAETRFHLYSAMAPSNNLCFLTLAAEYLNHLSPSTLHVHGATNALLFTFWKDASPGSRPSFVYTMHDYDEKAGEFSYLLDPDLVVQFTGVIPRVPALHFNGQLCPSSVGNHYSDITTFVSRTVVEHVEWSSSYQILLIMALRKLRENRFFGVPNGVDATSQHPWTNTPFGNRVLEAANITWTVRAPEDLTTFTRWEQKQHAKRWLATVGILLDDDVLRPLWLYIGRMTEDKGFSHCLRLAPLLDQMDATFVIIAPSTFTFSGVAALRNVSSRAKVIDLLVDQEAYGPVLRLAADFTFVPSKKEGFGLVAAESLLFGSVVVTTGVGGLKDFLRRPPNPDWNAYFFDPDVETSLGAIVFQAARDHRGRGVAQQTDVVNRLVRHGLDLDWKRGSSQRYNTVYDYAAKIRKRMRVSLTVLLETTVGREELTPREVYRAALQN